jgi:hypothetical protein
MQDQLLRSKSNLHKKTSLSNLQSAPLKKIDVSSPAVRGPSNKIFRGYIPRSLFENKSIPDVISLNQIRISGESNQLKSLV